MFTEEDRAAEGHPAAEPDLQGGCVILLRGIRRDDPDEIQLPRNQRTWISNSGIIEFFYCLSAFI